MISHRKYFSRIHVTNLTDFAAKKITDYAARRQKKITHNKLKTIVIEDKKAVKKKNTETNMKIPEKNKMTDLKKETKKKRKCKGKKRRQ